MTYTQIKSKGMNVLLCFGADRRDMSYITYKDIKTSSRKTFRLLFFKNNSIPILIRTNNSISIIIRTNNSISIIIRKNNSIPIIIRTNNSISIIIRTKVNHTAALVYVYMCPWKVRQSVLIS